MNHAMTMTKSDLANHPRAARRRRVRSSYPAALVELALVLCGTVGTREAASRLGVGMSTIYRWMELHRTAWMPRNVIRTDGRHIHEVVVALSTRCERAGFSLGSSDSGGSAAISTDYATVVSPRFATVGRKEGIADIAKTSTNEAPVMELMRYAKREIDENFATRLSCQTLADRVAMPRCQFVKKFAAAFGVPPYHYLLSVRVEHACALLQRSDIPLPAVAAATGFGSAASMQRAFKRFAGASPSKVVNVIAPARFASANSYAAQSLPEPHTASA